MSEASTDETTRPTVAVTGAAGYIGSRVVTRLREVHPDWEVRTFDNFYKDGLRTLDGQPVTYLDVRDRSQLEAALEGTDVVLHLAAVSGVDDCDENADLAYETNVVGTSNVAWFCRKSGAGLVFPYSMAVIGTPESFPITVDAKREPLNWYGRTKLASERDIETFADGAFPAHLYMKSNLYGEHVTEGRHVSKGTVINFFVERALAGEPLTVYEPGTQSRNYVHVKDIAEAYVHSVERLLEQREAGETGTWKYELASDQEMSVRRVAELVRDVATEELGDAPEVTLVENPRSDETLVEEFSVDTSKARSELGWEPTHSVESTVRDLLRGED
ncbi:NAD-dependent epimerase/dehydratase family protein [Halalkalicoccus ordinarius]|uniref:NAD-dependent epimerase/dehydratase family protein n=1 Tax=Halalkalicoccus ordinarius TaxID=3116651 RepID=UPI00300F128B